MTRVAAQLRFTQSSAIFGLTVLRMNSITRVGEACGGRARAGFGVFSRLLSRPGLAAQDGALASKVARGWWSV
jgi:hypothetical protein